MKRFRFSLERLLEYRHAKVEEARRQYAAVQAEVERIVFEIRSTQEQREELAGRLLEMHLNAQTRRELTEGRSYLEYLWLRILRLRSDLKSWQQRLDEARGALEEAERELEALERLREREFERHTRQEQRADERQSDEAGLNAFLRNRRQEAPDA